MSTRRFVYEVVLALAFTSSSIHLLNSRRKTEAQTRRFTTQIHALEDLLRRQRAGEVITDLDILKVRKRVGLLAEDDGVAPVSLTPKSEEDALTRKEVESIDRSHHVTQGSSDEEILSEWNKVLDEDLRAKHEKPSIVRLFLSGVSFERPLSTPPLSQAATVTNPELNHTETSPPSTKKPVFY
ncbi:hypothetical protein FRC17_002560 [Serendipita sp. 399]|nr:hypothetical protein FRC17_002560 [Serendipita sp. 399]